MLDTIIIDKVDNWTKEIEKRNSTAIFEETPVPLDDFLYSHTYLNLPNLSPKQYEFVKHGTNIYKEEDLLHLGWAVEPKVGELVAYWGKGCFTGDTKVSLLDGTEKSFEELTRDFKDRVFWVYSYNREKGIVPGLATNPRITKYIKELIEVTLDNNETIRCTPEHLFMLRDGSYKEAKDLEIGQSLMPYHKVTAIKAITLEKPIPVYDITVDKYHNFALSSGVFVHNSGKDFCSQIIQSRIAYMLLCLNNPQKYLGQAEITSIDMLNMAYNSDQAEQVFFKTFSAMIEECKWFSNKAKIGTSKIQFNKRIAAYSGNSFEEAFEGKNLIIAVLDEISAFKTKMEVEQMSIRRMRAPRYSAESVYDMAKSSIESRFGNGVGKLLSLSFPRFKNDYIQQLYERGKDEHTCYVSFGTTWEVNPNKKRSDFDDEFRKNPERAESRYACNPSSVEGGYFRNKEAIVRAFPIIPKDRVPTTDECFPTIKPFVRCTHNSLCSVHIDLALKKDKAGFCMSHVARTITELRKNERGERIETILPIVEIDIMTSFIAPLNGEIDFSKIRQLLVDLINRKYCIGKLSCDGYMSADFFQIVEKMGIETELRSVDRKTDAYDCLKELIYENRLLGYSYIRDIDTGTGNVIQANEIIDELSNLIFDGRRINHPAYGNKDISDSCAGSVQGAIEIGISNIVAGDIMVGQDREAVMAYDLGTDREYLSGVDDEYFTG